MPQFNVKIKRSDDQNLEFDLEDSDQTIANMLVDKLREDSHVTFAAYRVAHPLLGVPTIRVSTDGEEKPVEAVRKAVEALSEVLSKLMEDAKKIDQN
ncbi:MAG: RpoL/Rpb11 RNA polymerase subunit family protein [Thermoprotei archaeon]|nr:RpoL/Rpb11 RNA polymerase subunit family protein [TACK group archaeon]